MSLTETFWWYLENILEYFFQMLPCMGIALLIFLLLRPWRLGRLGRPGRGRCSCSSCSPQGWPP